MYLKCLFSNSLFIKLGEIFYEHGLKFVDILHEAKILIEINDHIFTILLLLD